MLGVSKIVIFSTPLFAAKTAVLHLGPDMINPPGLILSKPGPNQINQIPWSPKWLGVDHWGSSGEFPWSAALETRTRSNFFTHWSFHGNLLRWFWVTGKQWSESKYIQIIIFIGHRSHRFKGFQWISMDFNELSLGPRTVGSPHARWALRAAPRPPLHLRQPVTVASCWMPRPSPSRWIRDHVETCWNKFMHPSLFGGQHGATHVKVSR